ncbi:unnamed protein product, partial [Discosporangium mesarthrocarpum]
MLREVGTTFYQGVDAGVSDREPASPLLLHAHRLRAKQPSLGILHLLAAQAEVLHPCDAQFFLEVTRGFLLDCNAQEISIAPRLFAMLCHKYSQVCISEGVAIQALLPLRAAADKLAPMKTCLSPIHADFLHCCILAKCYGVSSRFVDERPIFSVDPRKTGLTPVHFLRYFYYSGVVHVGTKRWKDAVDNFRMVISTPANTLSALVVEAYKKLVLVSLIFSGKLTPLPKYTSHVVSRQLKSHIKEYIMVDNKFQAGDVEKLKAAVTNGREIFIQDGNMGLVKQVTEALMKRKIMQLTHTYITLSLDDIATTVGLSNSRVAENYILRMVESGEICAKIEHPVGTVHFKEDHNEVTPDIMLARLEDNLSTTVQLTDRIRRLDMQISVSPQYIQKV